MICSRIIHDPDVCDVARAHKFKMTGSIVFNENWSRKLILTKLFHWNMKRNLEPETQF